jgi:hypothetical protein
MVWTQKFYYVCKLTMVLRLNLHFTMVWTLKPFSFGVGFRKNVCYSSLVAKNVVTASSI